MPDWLGGRHIAHRGLHDAARGIIENTPPAIAAAMEADYAIEVDLQATGDGQAVVFHDATLERLTTQSGRVADLSVAALKRATFQHTDERMQTLAELLKQVAGRVPLVLELKAASRAGVLERHVAQALRGYRGGVAVMSFDPASMIEMRALAGEIPRGMLLPTAVTRRVFAQAMHDLWPMFRVRPAFLACHVDALGLAPVRALRKLGYRVAAWTVKNDKDRNRAERAADAMIFEGIRP